MEKKQSVVKVTYAIRVARLSKLESLHSTSDFLLDIHQETPEKVFEVVFVAKTAESRALLILLLKLLVMSLVARAQVSFCVHEEVVGTVAA